MIICHNIDHVLAVAERVVVFRQGEKVGDINKQDFDREDVVRCIITGKSNTVKN